MNRIVAIMTALALLSASACSIRQKPKGEDYYAQGQADFADHEYKAAVENYQKLIDEYPFSPYEEDAEMKIGLAYYQQKEYAEAISALDDFQRMHPTSKQLDLVTYYIAMSYYDQIGREDQDQSKTEAALKRFQEIEQRFPEGSFDELAREHVAVCREMLARHEMVVGDFYYKRANFRAAESRFAQLMQKYPDTPVAPDALWNLAVALQKEGKKYSAAQAYAALEKHFPNSSYAPKARVELRKLHQTIDTEEDPLPMVLAETGYPTNQTDATDGVVVRQRDSSVASSGGGSSYGADGLPVLTASAAGSSARRGSGDAGAGPGSSGGDMLSVPGSSGGASAGGMGASQAPSGGVASTLAASAAPASPPSARGVASSIASAAVPPPSAYAAPPAPAPAAPAPSRAPSLVPGGDMLAMNSGSAPPPSSPSLPTAVTPEPPPPAAPQMHEVTSLNTPDSPPAGSSGSNQSSELHAATPIQSEPVPGANTALANAPAPEPGPAMLKTIRLSSNNPPLTVIFDLTGPVRYEKSLEETANGATVTVVLEGVTPDGSVGKHIVFGRSIFKDCDVAKDSDKTTITLNMQPIMSYSVVPLDDPSRLLVTFTPQSPPDAQKTSANN